MRQHGYIACTANEDGWSATCKCGWRSRRYVRRKTAQHHLVDHITAKSRRRKRVA